MKPSEIFREKLNSHGAFSYDLAIQFAINDVLDEIIPELEQKIVELQKDHMNILMHASNAEGLAERLEQKIGINESEISDVNATHWNNFEALKEDIKKLEQKIEECENYSTQINKELEDNYEHMNAETNKRITELENKIKEQEENNESHEKNNITFLTATKSHVDELEQKIEDLELRWDHNEVIVEGLGMNIEDLETIEAETRITELEQRIEVLESKIPKQEPRFTMDVSDKLPKEKFNTMYIAEKQEPKPECKHDWKIIKCDNLEKKDRYHVKCKICNELSFHIIDWSGKETEYYHVDPDTGKVTKEDHGSKPECEPSCDECINFRTWSRTCSKDSHVTNCLHFKR